jgi:hypothetical protein
MVGNRIYKLVDSIPVIVQTKIAGKFEIFGKFSIFYPDAFCP